MRRRHGGYRTPVFVLDEVPHLEDPIMVVGLSGWVDAGMSGAQAIEVLAAQSAVRVLARGDSDALVDFSHTRPQIEGLGSDRSVEFPRVELSVGTATPAESESQEKLASLPRDIVVLTGPELSLRWESSVANIVDTAKTLGVTTIISLAGMPAPVSHRRPLTVLSVRFDRGADSRLPSEAVPARRPDYRGPTGMNAAILHAAGKTGIPALGLWAQVPLYLAGTSSVLGAAALIPVLNRIAGTSFDDTALCARAAFERVTIDEQAGRDSELAAAIAAADIIDDGGATALIAEIETYLDDSSSSDDDPLGSEEG